MSRVLKSHSLLVDFSAVRRRRRSLPWTCASPRPVRTERGAWVTVNTGLGLVIRGSVRCIFRRDVRTSACSVGLPRSRSADPLRRAVPQTVSLGRGPRLADSVSPPLSGPARVPRRGPRPDGAEMAATAEEPASQKKSSRTPGRRVQCSKLFARSYHCCLVPAATFCLLFASASSCPLLAVCR